MNTIAYKNIFLKTWKKFKLFRNKNKKKIITTLHFQVFKVKIRKKNNYNQTSR